MLSVLTARSLCEDDSEHARMGWSSCFTLIHSYLVQSQHASVPSALPVISILFVGSNKSVFTEQFSLEFRRRLPASLTLPPATWKLYIEEEMGEDHV